MLNSNKKSITEIEGFCHDQYLSINTIDHLQQFHPKQVMKIVPHLHRLTTKKLGVAVLPHLW